MKNIKYITDYDPWYSSDGNRCAIVLTAKQHKQLINALAIQKTLLSANVAEQLAHPHMNIKGQTIKF